MQRHTKGTTMMRTLLAVAATATVITAMPTDASAAGTYHGPTQRWATTPCASEDGRNCYWDASRQGDGRGRSFWAIPTADGGTTVVYWRGGGNRHYPR